MDAANFKEQFDLLQTAEQGSRFGEMRRHAFDTFKSLGIPTTKNEEWKYTRLGGLFNKSYTWGFEHGSSSLTAAELDQVRLPGHEMANQLFFINGVFSAQLSTVRSTELLLMPLEDAATGEYGQLVKEQFGDSSHYLRDGINALNTAFMHGAIFLQVPKNIALPHPVYVYHISDSRHQNTFSQPRSLVNLAQGSSLDMVETFVTFGQCENFTNHIIEIGLEQDAILNYYKIQNDSGTSSQVSTTHIRHISKSLSNSVVISLNGAVVRNNLNIVFDAPNCESHLYGLYCLKSHTHVDNHTMVDNAQPNCFSNELYKGVLDGDATGVFNGKIMVRKDAQKTNAYQSNKNILISDDASVNAKPQLEIFADDVKCSHGCTVGSLDDDALFYLQSRGVSKDSAQALLLQAFAIDVLDNIKLAPLRQYVEQLISQRLEITES